MMGFFSSKQEVSVRVSSEGRTFDVKVSGTRGGFEVNAEGFASVDGLIAALRAVQDQMDQSEPVRISIKPVR